LAVNVGGGGNTSEGQVARIVVEIKSCNREQQCGNKVITVWAKFVLVKIGRGLKQKFCL